MFQNAIKKLEELISQKIQFCYDEYEIPSVFLENPRERSHGDYALNIAMQLSKILSKPPREIAEILKPFIEEIEEILSVEIAGPGFININLKSIFYLQSLKEVYEEDLYTKSFGNNKEKTIIVEYPSANVAKPLAIHHLLPTVIGQTFYNISKKEGFKVVSIDHLGDYGTQFGKIIYAYKNFEHDIDIQKADVFDLLNLYVEFCKKEKDNDEFSQKARDEFAKLENNDKENNKLLKLFIKISCENMEKTLEKLTGIHIDEVIGESFYTDKMDEIVEEGKKRNIFTMSDGALIATFEEENMPTVLIKKSDGATLYITRDLATLKYRKKRWNPHEIIYCVDVAQKLHFQQLFTLFGKLYGEDENIALTHIGFGRMSFKDGRKMSTRSGEVLLLNDVIDESISRSRKIIKTYKPNMDEIHLEHLSKICGIGALKYNVLSQNIHKNFSFDWGSMLALEGNSAPYLQYAHARAKSILEKTDLTEFKIDIEDDMEIEEKYIIQGILKFPEIVTKVHVEYKPNILCTYLFEMTQDYNSLYAKFSILQADTENKKNLRLLITELFAITLKEGLKLLGIEAPDRM